MEYPVAATSSVEAVQVSLISDAEVTVPIRFVGTVGAVVSGGVIVRRTLAMGLR